jgi:hypothetical protein
LARMVGDRTDPTPGRMAGFGADVAGYADVYFGGGISIFAGWYYLVLHSRMAARSSRRCAVTFDDEVR